MRLRSLLLVGVAAGVLSACSTFSPKAPPAQQLPLYGDYKNIDNQSLCLGIMAYAVDFPQTVWLNQTKEFYNARREEYSQQSTALYAIAVKKFGKEDAGKRGIAGYESAKSLAYVLGGEAVQTALSHCQPVAADALTVNKEYESFLKKLRQDAPEKPVIADVVPEKLRREEPVKPVLIDEPKSLNQSRADNSTRAVVKINPEDYPERPTMVRDLPDDMGDYEIIRPRVVAPKVKRYEDMTPAEKKELLDRYHRLNPPAKPKPVQKRGLF